jgi:sialate O-acetylesterase
VISSIKLICPHSYQVFQRSDCDTASICIEGSYGGQSCCSVHFRLGTKAGKNGTWKEAETFDNTFVGAVHDVPTGGTYCLDIEARDANGKALASCRVRELLVGDLWVLAGQSNMDGRGKLDNLEPPHRMAHAYYYDESWDIARDPLCSPNESIDPVHWDIQDADEREESNRKNRMTRQTGAGLGVRFAKDLFKATHVPIGLIICSHGGTNMAQWNPALKSHGGESLYGSMLRRINAVGGEIAGFLWYQGENDALYPPEGKPYKENFREFIACLRSDLESSKLPFIYAQLGLTYHFDDPLTGTIGWNGTQNDQLSLSTEVENAAMVATVDSSLADYIHLDSASLRRLGSRMALMARRIRFGESGIESGPRPTECRFIDSERTRIGLTFDGVNGRLHPAKGIIGFEIEADDGGAYIADCRIDKTDKNIIIIECVQPVPSGARLWHGHGLNPACNLKDNLGLPAPVFGPIIVETHSDAG